MKRRHSLIMTALLLLALPAAAHEMSGYLGIEVVGNEIVYLRNYTPAERSGLKTGDVIIAIDGQSVEGMGRDVISAKLEGAPWEKVKIKVRRGKEIIEVELTREASPAGFVPTGLSAGQYFSLGIKQRELGYPNEARDCMNKAIELDKNGTVGKRAERYLRTEIPLHFVPEHAQTLNNLAWNLSRSDRDEEAEKVFRNCIEQYPDFEWPRNNLAGILRCSKRYAEAQQQLDYILNMHSDYVSSWIELANLNEAQGKIKEAKACARHALQLDPESKSARETCQRLQVP